MAYDEKLAERIRKMLSKRADDVTERKMFGGLCFLVEGSMCCGVLGPDLIVKVGRDAYEDAVSQPHARPFDFTGRPSRGIVYVAPAGTRSGPSLLKWIRRAEVLAPHSSAGPPRTG